VIPHFHELRRNNPVHKIARRTVQITIQRLAFNAINQLACCDTKYRVMFETAERICRQTLAFERCFVFITAVAEMPASHEYEVANEVKIRRL